MSEDEYRHYAVECLLLAREMRHSAHKAVLLAMADAWVALADQAAAAIRGVTVPWTLAASCVVGAWLMLSRLVFGTDGAVANSDHLVGAMIITIAVCAMAEVARPLRVLNLVCGLWLIAAPWLVAGSTTGAALNDVVAGLVVIGLSLQRGRRSKEHYGSWDRYVV